MKNKNKKYPIIIGIFAVLIILITIGALYITEQSAIGDSDLSVIITHSGAWDDNRASSMIGNVVFHSTQPFYDVDNVQCQYSRDMTYSNYRHLPEPHAECWKLTTSFESERYLMSPGDVVRFGHYLEVEYLDSSSAEVLLKENDIYDDENAYSNNFAVTLKDGFTDIAYDKINHTMLLDSDVAIRFNIQNNLAPYDGAVIVTVQKSLLGAKEETSIKHTFTDGVSVMALDLPTDTLGKVTITYIFTHDIFPGKQNQKFLEKTIIYTVVDEMPVGYEGETEVVDDDELAINNDDTRCEPMFFTQEEPREGYSWEYSYDDDGCITDRYLQKDFYKPTKTEIVLVSFGAVFMVTIIILIFALGIKKKK